MASFTDSMTKPDGLVVQFGDNDSGRFITLGSGEQVRGKNDPSSVLWSLDHRSLIACIQSVVNREIDATHGIVDPAALILGAIGGEGETGLKEIDVSFASIEASDGSSPSEAVWFDLLDRFGEAPSISCFTCSFKTNVPGLLNQSRFTAFPGMGAYVVRGPRIYLAVRCGEIGLAGLGGHAHCDQLAVELVIDGITKIRDPGTLVYTPLPNVRNAYRSAMAHHVPRVQELELADMARGIFDLRDCAEGQCLYFGPRGFVGRHYGYGEAIYRIIELQQERVRICDFAEGGLSVSDPTPARLPFSQGYGRITAE